MNLQEIKDALQKVEAFKEQKARRQTTTDYPCVRKRKSEKAAEYYQKNKERIKAYRKKMYYENREREIARASEYYHKHKFDGCI